MLNTIDALKEQLVTLNWNTSIPKLLALVNYSNTLTEDQKHELRNRLMFVHKHIKRAVQALDEVKTMILNKP